MSHFPEYRVSPMMNPASVLAGDCWRVGVITDSLIRLEWQDDGRFEDQPTQTVLNREWGEPVEFRHFVRDGRLTVETRYFMLSYDMKPFSKEGLSVVVRGVNSTQNTWHYGDDLRCNTGNLGGTARTLDEANGAIPIGDGVLSRAGWAVLDDSTSMSLVRGDEVGQARNPFGMWVEPRSGGRDLYLFCYGHRYIDAIRDFYHLTGPVPLLPRFVFGNWWSRYHRYSETEYLDLMKRFEAESIPFSTAIIDMDWHLVDDVPVEYGSGWTGYTWNRKLFPDPSRFLGSLHDHGLKVALNLHPRDGIRAYEEGYAKLAAAMGIDPKSRRPVEFDVTDPKFMQAYFDLHHDLERQGVDFWWLDWQQGGVTRQRGLDPLWMLNHLHYLDSARDGRWPLTFSRYAGPGSHRYPIGFSGDTIVTWDSLRFQPYFTATASNIGYAWWSHDIGGHMLGNRDEELEARWYQLGAFSPINRLHSSDSPFNGKEPWNFRLEVRTSMESSLRLRQELLPYLYTMNWRAALDGRPIVEPMYWQSPEDEEAYRVDDEFRFGTELIVSPIVRPAERESQLAGATVWLPQGTWFDFFTGRRYEAPSGTGRRFEAFRSLDGVPVFAKAGGIVPMQPLDSSNGPVNSVENPQIIRLVVFPGADGQFTLYEDDGDYAQTFAAGNSVSAEATGAMRDAVSATGTASEEKEALFGVTPRRDASNLVKTRFALHWSSNSESIFTVSSADGAVGIVPNRRSWVIVFRGVNRVERSDIEVRIDGDAASCNVLYDDRTFSLTLCVENVAVSAKIDVIVDGGLPFAADTRVEDAYAVLYRAQIAYRDKEEAYGLIRGRGIDSISSLYAMGTGSTDMSCEALNAGVMQMGMRGSNLPTSVIMPVVEQLQRF